MGVPNPVTDVLNFDASTGTDEKINLQVINNVGQTIITRKFPAALNQLDVSDLSAGVYFIEMFNSSGRLMKRAKFIKL